VRLNEGVKNELIDLLRSDLSTTGYTTDAVAARLGPAAEEALGRDHTVPAERVLDARAGRGQRDPLDVLVDLFLLGRRVVRSDVDAAFPALGVDGGRELGLLSADGTGADSWRAALDVHPYAFTDDLGVGHWWILSDLGERAVGGVLPEDHVLGVGGASLTLAGITVPTRVGSVLDLGTGCGIQALHASRTADRVVATDISERAVALARANARLNRVESIEVRHGDLFEPVAGERFDRIVTNPPFVITPRAEGVPSYDYRDGGMVGDALVEAVVRGCADHLLPGGTAQMLGNWEYTRASDGLSRVGGWLDGLGLDAWVVEREHLDPAFYAETWIRDGGTRPGTAAFDRLSGAWLDDFQDRGVSGVGFGFVTLHRPASADREPVVRLERVTGALETAGLGSHIATCVSAVDRSSGLGDDAFAALALRVAPDVTVEHHFVPGQDEPTAILLRQGQGFRRAISAGTALAALVGASDGSLGVGAIVAAIAQLLEVDAEALAAETLPDVRRLLADGILLLE
jgi:methylase of polypeptide subunit release factors